MIILTPNRRLAAFSQQQFNRAQIAAQKTVWNSAEIYSIKSWLEQLWDKCLDNNLAAYKPLLSPKQQQILLEKIIQQTEISQQLLRVNATAQNVIQAWELLQQWQIDLEKVQAYAEFSADTQAFCIWVKEYIQWMAENSYTDFHAMVELVIQNLPKIAHILPKHICLRGFNELTPQYTVLVQQLQLYGVEISHDQLTTPGARVIKTAYKDPEEEIRYAAYWASELLFEESMDLTIGIVIPELEQLRDEVHNIFMPNFSPGWVNISAPLPLSSYAIISCALQILQLATYKIAYEDFSILLRSAFIAGFMRAGSSRARLDRKLREDVEATITWDKLIAQLSTETLDDVLIIKQYVEQFAALIDTLKGKHEARYWTEQIQKLLYCWGWPGDQIAGGENCGANYVDDLNIAEDHLLSCWHALFKEYCDLDFILDKHTFAEAIQIIQRLANETPFAPAETGVTKIHVLGLLEAEGLVFDHLWVCGMRRDTWPNAVNPNPFIPLELQRQYDLPHSSAARELAMAQKYTANLAQGGKKSVVFSYPQFVDDYAMQPSNLLEHIPFETIKFKEQYAPFIPDPLELWQDEQNVALTESYFPGGSSALRLQAQCPFRANAELRLNARPLNAPQNLLTPMQRGSLTHAILEKFWRKCNGHAQLVAHSSTELAGIVNEIVQRTLQEWLQELPQTLSNNYLLLEAQRLNNLILRWLELEAQRPPFVRYQVEEKNLVSIGPLQIHVQCDRVDQIDAGFAIIDYKTGITNLNDWFSDPIYEPQMPLYAVTLAKEVVAVAYATLRAQELKFSGAAQSEDLLPNLKVQHDWVQTLRDWQHKLSNTAQDFFNGQAAVTPYDQKVCNTCSLQALCHIYEQDL